MNPIHAGVFCLLGAGMFALPGFFPGWFAGTNTSALWLQFTGGVNAAIGAGWLLVARVVPAVVRALAWRPVLPPVLAPAQLLRPAMEFYEEIEEELGAASAELRPVPVRTGRRAA